MRGSFDILTFLSLLSLLLSPGISGAGDASGPFTVVLDAGHDPTDPGIRNGTVIEKDLTLQWVQSVASKLKTRPDLSVVLTRKGDYPLSFDERRRIANMNRTGVFVSVHFGPSVRIFLLNGVKSSDPGRLVPLSQAHLVNSAESLSFADLLQEELTPVFPETKVEVTFLNLAPIEGIRMPAVLVEARPMTATDAMDRFADSMTRAIDRFRNEGKNPAP